MKNQGDVTKAYTPKLEGFLSKRGKLFGGLKSNYYLFVRRKSSANNVWDLHYGIDRQAVAAALGGKGVKVIDLKSATLAGGGVGDKEWTILGAKREFRLMAADVKQAAAWKTEIQSAIDANNKGGGPSHIGGSSASKAIASDNNPAQCDKTESEKKITRYLSGNTSVPLLNDDRILSIKLADAIWVETFSSFRPTGTASSGQIISMLSNKSELCPLTELINQMLLSEPCAAYFTLRDFFFMILPYIAKQLTILKVLCKVITLEPPGSLAKPDSPYNANSSCIDPKKNRNFGDVEKKSEDEKMNEENEEENEKVRSKNGNQAEVNAWVAIKLRALELIDFWTTLHQEDVTVPFRRNFVSLLEDYPKDEWSEWSDEMKTVERVKKSIARKLKDTIHRKAPKKKFGYIIAPYYFPARNRGDTMPVVSANTDPRKLAEQWTLATFDRMCLITPRQIHRREKPPTKEENQNRISEHNSMWVSSTTIAAKCRKCERNGVVKEQCSGCMTSLVSAYTFWLKVAAECLNLRNYLTTFEIFSGLCNKSVARLGIKEHLKKEALDIFSRLEKITLSGQNYNAYRQAMGCHQGEASIPYVTVYLYRRVQHIEDSAKLAGGFKQKNLIGSQCAVPSTKQNKPSTNEETTVAVSHSENGLDSKLESIGSIKPEQDLDLMLSRCEEINSVEVRFGFCMDAAKILKEEILDHMRKPFPIEEDAEMLNKINKSMMYETYLPLKLEEESAKHKAPIINKAVVEIKQRDELANKLGFKTRLGREEAKLLKKAHNALAVAAKK